MIHGTGVGFKFDVIVQGYDYELRQSAKTEADHQAVTDTVYEYRFVLRQMRHEELDELFVLYSETYPHLASTKRRKKQAALPLQ